MAEEKAVNKVDAVGARDRVAMLSLRADGTPDQTAPEFIGDRDAAVAATKVQFSEQAVSAVDEKLRAEAHADSGEVSEDPSIAEAKKAHDAAAKAAEAHAADVVKSLHA